ncbi:O-succinylbenzoic acid--CoA ligase [Aquimarina sp. EL_43]|uniref:AMP-binding protein n=1 Tax=Aquimarina TaxID=290174 RepID=UPI000472CB9C|nr:MULTISPECIES: AMP-binding protein [Aquimarina]MBG6129356.1 O-succinylbenzoic acid--CoA ligase [Aquimarina sp. EL_35]MBG6150421.1 O-succinylbenzoic acid--CoA ligase [Aquimarina sp. EL_32]MBG6168271.1 O-succinylbenzoic acid--CoA ligase [Aquimarina sp. EL_43]
MQTKSTFSIPEIHQSFSINKNCFDKERLKSLAYGFIKEGEVYEQEAGSFLLDWLNEKDHIVVQTSGSTGKPKKIKVYKQHMINSAIATGKFFKSEEGTTALLCLPANYIAGKMMLVRAMVLGWKIDLVPPRTNPLDTVYKQYDFCAMVPLQLDNSLNRLHLIKKLIVGGGPVSENLKELVQGFKTKIFETYGMTETVSHIAARRINPKKKDKKDAHYFKALPNITLSIDNRNCLIIKAPQLNEETIITNDVVELKTYKKFLWKGRHDNVINSGGVKLYPEEIETKLQLLIGHRFFITSIPDDTLGDKVILLIEREYDKIAYLTLQEAIQNLNTLNKYEIPKEIYFIPQFIGTENGKVQRKQTVELAMNSKL